MWSDLALAAVPAAASVVVYRWSRPPKDRPRPGLLERRPDGSRRARWGAAPARPRHVAKRR